MSRTGSSSDSSDRKPTKTKVRPRPSTDQPRLERPALGPVRARPPLPPTMRMCPCRASSTSGKTSAGPSGCRLKEGRTGPACVSGLDDLKTRPSKRKICKSFN